jgi:hypothetical protein
MALAYSTSTIEDGSCDQAVELQEKREGLSEAREVSMHRAVHMCMKKQKTVYVLCQMYC